MDIANSQFDLKKEDVAQIEEETGLLGEVSNPQFKLLANLLKLMIYQIYRNLQLKSYELDTKAANDSSSRVSMETSNKMY